MDLFAIPRDVRDIIWAKSRVMLREERERIKTYYVKEVLREYWEYMLEHEEKYDGKDVEVDGEHITNGISLTKCYNSYPYCTCDLEIIGNTCTLYFSDEDYTYYRLDGFKACEVFNNGNVKDYFKKEFCLNRKYPY
jgi:hypothetical protein